MSLWVDRNRPNTLGKLSLHADVNAKISALAQSEELPHLMFYGPPGAGKKTRVLALLREIYGAGAERIKLEHRTFKNASGKPIEISTLGSNYHIECNPSDVGNNDRFVIQEVIKEIASHTNLSSAAGAPGSRSFKIVLLTEVDRLSKQAQAGLRRTMEKYSSQCRIILLCNSPSKIIEPVRSRCLSIRIPAPSHDDIANLLVQIAKKESCQCPMELAAKISLHSERNVRRAVLMLEAAKVQIAPATQMLANQPVQLPDWQIFITRLAREIMAEQSPSRLLQAREMLYNLLTNCIPADVIMTTLVGELMKCLDDQLKHEVTHWAAYYEHRMCKGSKDIFHLEAFVAKFMAIYKKWLMSLFG